MKALCRLLLGTLRGRLVVGVAAVHAVMMALFIIDLTARQRVMLLDRQAEEATALSQALATSAAGWIAARDISGLQEIVEAQRRYPEIIFVILADQEGRVLADTDTSRRGRYMLDLPREARQTVLGRTPALVDVAAPALIGGRHVGWSRVGIGQRAAGEKLAEITRSGVIYALAAILLGSVIAWFMGRRISRRLYSVQETIDAVRSGDHLARSSLAGDDEAAVMAREFNSMLDALAARDAELRVSEERFRSLIQKVPAAIVLHDGQGCVLNSNLLAQELLGLSADQLLGRALVDPEWHFVREDGTVMPVAEYPVSLVFATRQSLRNYVMGISRPDRDDIVWVLVNAEPEYDEAGGGRWLSSPFSTSPSASGPKRLCGRVRNSIGVSWPQSMRGSSLWIGTTVSSPPTRPSATWCGCRRRGWWGSCVMMSHTTLSGPASNQERSVRSGAPSRPECPIVPPMCMRNRLAARNSTWSCGPTPCPMRQGRWGRSSRPSTT